MELKDINCCLCYYQLFHFPAKSCLYSCLCAMENRIAFLYTEQFLITWQFCFSTGFNYSMGWPTLSYSTITTGACLWLTGTHRRLTWIFKRHWNSWTINFMPKKIVLPLWDSMHYQYYFSASNLLLMKGEINLTRTTQDLSS